MIETRPSGRALPHHIRLAASSYPWLPQTAILVVLVAPIVWMTTDLQPDFSGRQLYLRAGCLLAALGLCFAFDDLATDTVATMPAPLRRRRIIRALAGLGLWALTVAIVLATGATDELRAVIVLSNPYDPTEFPVGRLLLEAGTLASWGLGIAAALGRTHHEPGRIASTILILLYAASWMIPHRWKPWADPTVPRWTTSLPWWWTALAIGLSVTVLLSWDSRQFRRLRHGRVSSLLHGR